MLGVEERLERGNDSFESGALNSCRANYAMPVSQVTRAITCSSSSAPSNPQPFEAAHCQPLETVCMRMPDLFIQGSTDEAIAT